MGSTSSVADMPVLALARPGVAEVRPESDLVTVCEILHDSDVGVLVVAGVPGSERVVSERDVVRAIASGADLRSTRADDVASSDVLACSASTTVSDASGAMLARRVRHLLVRQGGQLLAVISERDLLAAYTAGSQASDPTSQT